MLENADALVLFKEYPHTDAGERAPELFDGAVGAVARLPATKVQPG